MSKEHIFDLIAADADGALNPAEQAELDRLLEVSPDARRFQADLHRLEALLSKVPELEAPEWLHEQIMNRIPAPDRKERTGGLGFAVSLPGFRYALAAAAGVLLAIAVYELNPWLRQPAANYQDMAGTIAAHGSRAESRTVDSYELNTPELSGRVQLQNNAGTLALEVRTVSSAPVDIFIDFSATTLRPDGFTGHDGSLEFTEMASGALRVRAAGRQHVTVSLRRADVAAEDHGKIGLEFSSNGKVLQRGSLSPAS